MFHTIEEIDLKEKKIFIRVDFNVSLHEGQITDDTRIKASLPTIQYALNQQACVILASHLGRPQGKKNDKLSLLPIAEHLSKLMNKDVFFPEDCIGDAARKLAANLRNGEIMLLENLRFHEGEEKNDPLFSKKLAQMADVYINDAFGSAHRAHASTVGMVSYFKEKGVGLLMKKEIDYLGQLLEQPRKPYLAIIGGAKVSDKISVLENLMNHVDGVLIGGGMAYTFLRAQGISTGTSLVEEAKINQAKKILKRAEDKGIFIQLPSDSILIKNLDAPSPHKCLTNKENWEDWMGVDIGPQTLLQFKQHIQTAKTIFWNGPMGIFEIPPFDNGTLEVAKMIAEHENTSVIGGGDSLAAIQQSGLADRFSHLSTGGGASLEFLEGKSLPGLKAVEIEIS